MDLVLQAQIIFRFDFWRTNGRFINEENDIKSALIIQQFFPIKFWFNRKKNKTSEALNT